MHSKWSLDRHTSNPPPSLSLLFRLSLDGYSDHSIYMYFRAPPSSSRRFCLLFPVLQREPLSIVPSRTEIYAFCLISLSPGKLQSPFHI